MLPDDFTNTDYIPKVSDSSFTSQIQLG